MPIQYSTRKSRGRFEEDAPRSLSSVRPIYDVAAISASDLHIWHKAPPSRSAEPDWFEAQRRPLRQLRKLKRKYDCPVLYTGDIFDKFNPTPECINFALQELVDGYGIPGQHDLPHHNYEDIRKSGYWTLVKAGKIINLEPGKPVDVGSLRLHGFPWGFPVTALEHSHAFVLQVAIVHAYIWTKSTGYVNAPKEKRLGSYLPALKNYHAAFFGDNHKGFLCRPKHNGAWVCNNGTFLRRKIDEKEYEPTVGLLHKDGSISRHKLDCSEDKFLSDAQLAKELREEVSLSEFLAELSSLADASIDFHLSIVRALERQNVNKRVSKIILKALESK